MATPYDKVYQKCLGKLTDFNLLEIDDYTLDTMMLDWLNSSIVMVRKCEHDLSQRDDETAEFTEDLSEMEIELLALGMTYAWLDQYINSNEYTSLFIGGKEEKLFSPSSQLQQLRGRKDDIRQEMNRIHNYFTYTNGTYFG